MFIEIGFQRNFEAPGERNVWIRGSEHFAPPELKTRLRSMIYKHLAALRLGIISSYKFRDRILASCLLKNRIVLVKFLFRKPGP